MVVNHDQVLERRAGEWCRYVADLIRSGVGFSHAASTSGHRMLFRD